MTEQLHQPLAIRVYVPIGATDEERRAAVLDTLARHGYALTDVVCEQVEVTVVERSPERSRTP